MGATPAIQRGQTLDASVIALSHLRAQAPALGLAAADVEDVVVSSSTTSKHTGVSHVYLRQRFSGIEVWSAEITVNISRDGRVLGVEGRFVAGLEKLRPRTTPRLTASEAVAVVARHLELTPTEPIRVVSEAKGPARETMLSTGGLAVTGIPAKLVFFPEQRVSVRLAWLVEIEERSAQHWWVVLIDATTGALLEKYDRVVAELL